MDIQSRILGMTAAAHEVLRCLFIHGPTWDGDIPSKAGRGELFELGLASRENGWSYITKEGMDFAVNVLLLGEEKDRRDNQRRARS